MNVVEETIKSLQKNGFEVYFARDEKDACDILLQMIPPRSTVGVGGSLTIRQVGILEVLREKGYVVFDHWQNNLSPDERLAIRFAQQTCDVFLSSANAITVQGELVNIDGLGNRVSALAFGPKNVIIVAGVNKIVKDLTEGLKRSKEAAVKNALRLHRKTPCVQTGQCSDCSSPQRICNITQIIHRRPSEGGKYLNTFKILLVDRELGY